MNVRRVVCKTYFCEMIIRGSILPDKIMDSAPKQAWELVVRRHALLPRHSTANDDASVLLRIAILFVAAAAVLLLAAPWYVSHFVGHAALVYSGLGLQQYAFYTGRVYSDCWTDEGAPVMLLTVGVGFLLGAIFMVSELLFSPFMCLVLLGALHAGMLTSCRWAFWGSLFDGNDKLHDQRARRSL